MKAQKKQIPTAPQPSPEEKCRSRYLFGALGQILYAMPSVALLGMIYVMGAAVPGIITGAVVIACGIALGFTALALLKKEHGRSLLTFLCCLMVVPHIVSLILLGGWYAVLLPAFLLDMLLLSGLSVLGK